MSSTVRYRPGDRVDTPTYTGEPCWRCKSQVRFVPDHKCVDCYYNNNPRQIGRVWAGHWCGLHRTFGLKSTLVSPGDARWLVEHGIWEKIGEDTYREKWSPEFTELKRREWIAGARRRIDKARQKVADPNLGEEARECWGFCIEEIEKQIVEIEGASL
jgi:hypothetical protein